MRSKLIRCVILLLPLFNLACSRDNEALQPASNFVVRLQDSLVSESSVLSPAGQGFLLSYIGMRNNLYRLTLHRYGADRTLATTRILEFPSGSKPSVSFSTCALSDNDLYLAYVQGTPGFVLHMYHYDKNFQLIDSFVRPITPSWTKKLLLIPKENSITLLYHNGDDPQQQHFMVFDNHLQLMQEHHEMNFPDSCFEFLRLCGAAYGPDGSLYVNGTTNMMSKTGGFLNCFYSKYNSNGVRTYTRIKGSFIGDDDGVDVKYWNGEVYWLNFTSTLTTNRKPGFWLMVTDEQGNEKRSFINAPEFHETSVQLLLRNNELWVPCIGTNPQTGFRVVILYRLNSQLNLLWKQVYKVPDDMINPRLIPFGNESCLLSFETKAPGSGWNYPSINLLLLDKDGHVLND